MIARIHELREDLENIQQAWRWVVQYAGAEQISAHLENLIEYHLSCSLPSDGIEVVRWAADYLEGARKSGQEPDPDYSRVESQLRIAMAWLLIV